MKKRLAHEYFDTLHDFIPLLRRKAYEILAERMAIYAGFAPLLQEKYRSNLQGMQHGQKGITHIRYFNDIECEAVIEIVKAMYHEAGHPIDSLSGITPAAKAAVKQLLLSHLSMAKFLVSSKSEVKPTLEAKQAEIPVVSDSLLMDEAEKEQFMYRRLVSIQEKIIKKELLTEAEQMLLHGIKEQFYDYDHSETLKNESQIIKECYQNSILLREIIQLYPELLVEYQFSLTKEDLKKEENINTPIKVLPSVVEVKKQKSYRLHKPHKGIKPTDKETRIVQSSVSTFNREIQHQIEKEEQERLNRQAEAKDVKEKLEAALNKQANLPIGLDEGEVLRERRNQYFKSIMNYTEAQLVQEYGCLKTSFDLDASLRNQFLQIVTNQLKLRAAQRAKQESLKEKEAALLAKQKRDLEIQQSCKQISKEVDWLIESIFAEENFTNADFVKFIYQGKGSDQYEASQERFKSLCKFVKFVAEFDVKVVKQKTDGSFGVRINYSYNRIENEEKIKVIAQFNQQKMLLNKELMIGYFIGKYFEWLGIVGKVEDLNLSKGRVQFTLKETERKKLQAYYVDSLCSFMQTFCVLDDKTQPSILMEDIIRKFMKLVGMYEFNDKRIVALIDEPKEIKDIFISKITNMKKLESASMSEVAAILIEVKKGDIKNQEKTEVDYVDYKVEVRHTIHGKAHSNYFSNFIRNNGFLCVANKVFEKKRYFTPSVLMISGVEAFLSKPFPPFIHTSLPPIMFQSASEDNGHKKASIPFAGKIYTSIIEPDQLPMVSLIKEVFTADKKPSVIKFNELLKKFFDPEAECNSYELDLRLKVLIDKFKKILVEHVREKEEGTEIVVNFSKERKFIEALKILNLTINKGPTLKEIVLFTAMLSRVEKSQLIELCQQNAKAKGI